MIEKDPNGLAPNQPGAKVDAGKVDLDLVFSSFARALMEVGKVGTEGANKYVENGWLDVPRGRRRYTSALFRHYLKECMGEEVEPDFGLLHSAHLAWNALARLELQLREIEEEEKFISDYNSMARSVRDE